MQVTALRVDGTELRPALFFFQAEDGIRDLVRSRGLGDVYKRQDWESLRSQYLAVLGPLVVGFGTQIVIGALSYLLPVSYTHLTLPTIYSV